eukprot:scaffold486936_cov36-Prasinocladus_malaysianus.AAC.1
MENAITRNAVHKLCQAQGGSGPPCQPEPDPGSDLQPVLPCTIVRRGGRLAHRGEYRCRQCFLCPGYTESVCTGGLTSTDWQLYRSRHYCNRSLK